MIAGNLVVKLQVIRILHVHKLSKDAHHEYLANLLFQGKFLQGLFRPALALMIEMNARGFLEVVRSNSTAERQQQRAHQQQLFQHETEDSTRAALSNWLL